MSKFLALGAALRLRNEVRNLEPQRRTKRLRASVGTAIGLHGRVVNVQVLERDGSVSWESGAFDNLILDQGMNQVASNLICNLFLYVCAGTGNTAPAAAQTGLVAEVARTANYLSGAGNCGTTRPTATTQVHRRTYDFPLGAINANIAELGFSSSASAGANLFSRVLVQSGGTPTAVTVTSAQQLRVVYELTTTFSNVDQAVNMNFGGAWGAVTGTGRIQDTAIGVISNVTATGPTNTGNFQLEPSVALSIAATDSAAALNAIGTGAYVGTGTAKTPTLATYTNGTFFRDKSVTFSTTEANHNIQSLFLCINGTAGCTFRVLMTAAKTKTNLATLTLTFRVSWARN